MGQHLTYRYTSKTKSKNNYQSNVRVYKAQRCIGCPLRAVCHKAKTNRIVQINPNLKRHKKIAHQNLWSLRGIYLRQQRCIEPEPVFGQIKWNRGFKRFSLRGLPKVNCEFGLIAIAHNLKKMWIKPQLAKGLPNPPHIPPKSAQILAETAKNSLKTIFYLVNPPGAPHNTKLKLQLVNNC